MDNNFPSDGLYKVIAIYCIQNGTEKGHHYLLWSIKNNTTILFKDLEQQLKNMSIFVNTRIDIKNKKIKIINIPNNIKHKAVQ